FGDALRALLPSLLVAGVVAAGFALIVAGLLSRTITRPLRELVAGARRFARGEYRTRVPVAGPSEVAELGGAVNAMAGEIERARERVEVTALGSGAVAALEVQAHEAGVTLDVTTDGLPAVRGDPDKLAQLFTNLIDNAVKHSPRGASVAVRGAREDGQAVVRVRDAGSGLPGGAQTRLFRRFYRG